MSVTNKFTLHDNMSQKSGAYLEIAIGCMYSGKTSFLVELYKQYKFCDISVAVINHLIDNRYDNEMMSTHDKVKIPCIKTDKLMDLYSEHININSISKDMNVYLDVPINSIPRLQDKFKVMSSEVILINEGQFFTDLEEFVKLMLVKGKKIYVSGLDGDFERKKFGHILNLIPLCDKVTKLTSLCSLCKDGTRAIFSKRLTNETEQTVVGSDNYIPVCRSCYEK